MSFQTGPFSQWKIFRKILGAILLLKPWRSKFITLDGDFAVPHVDEIPFFGSGDCKLPGRFPDGHGKVKRNHAPLTA